MSYFRGKTVVVLGASSEDGSGWETAKLFAAQGANVVVGARSMAGVEKLAKQINGFAVQCDVADEAQVEAMAKAAVERYGGIDVAVLAAGVPFVGTIDSTDSDVLKQATAINFFGPFYFVRYMAREMNNQGSIVIITSASSHRVVPGYPAYGSAKGAANTLVKYAAMEYAPRGIRVNAVVAGVIESPLVAPLKADEKLWQVIMKEIPLKKGVQPLQIGQTCVWLSTPEAALTGNLIDVDNGNHLTRPPQPEEMPTE